MTSTDSITPTCLVQQSDDSRILMAHGGGGTLMHRLIDDVFLSKLAGSRAEDQHDAAIVEAHTGRVGNRHADPQGSEP